MLDSVYSFQSSFGRFGSRFGIKSYELCEALTGYVLNIILYTGKGTTTSNSVFGFTTATAKIVLELFKDYLGKGYALFMDNYYNSVILSRFLKRHKTDVVGTLNRRRTDCPVDIKNINDKRIPHGSVVSPHCGDVSVAAWKDVKLVTTLSTYHNANMVPGMRAGLNCPKPELVHDYNKFMGGVDLKDQKLSMYLLERKRGIKWYIKVFRRLLNITIFFFAYDFSLSLKTFRRACGTIRRERLGPIVPGQPLC